MVNQAQKSIQPKDFEIVDSPYRVRSFSPDEATPYDLWYNPSHKNPQKLTVNPLKTPQKVPKKPINFVMKLGCLA